MQIVDYHHPDYDSLSLCYSSDDLDTVRERAEGMDDSTYIISYEFEQPVHVLYHGEVETATAEDLELDQEYLEDQLEVMNRHDLIITLRLFRLFRSVVDAHSSTTFRTYKDLQLDRVPDALSEVDWGTKLPSVAGQLMSNLILRHSLPNANHRTAIAMLQLCIETSTKTFDMPRTHVDDETWREWVDPYIATSKRYITVRRNNRRFYYLEQLGVDAIRRKDGLLIEFKEYELSMSYHDAWEQYAEKHELLCTEFAQEVIERSGQSSLLSAQGPTKTELANYLETGVSDEDIDGLF